MPSLVFPSDGSGNCKAELPLGGTPPTVARPSPEHALWAQGCTSQGERRTHTRTPFPPMPYRPLQFGFMLALLPIGYQYEPFCFVCAGRGNAPAPLLYTDQVYHLITPRGAHGSALAQQHGCPVTARSRQHSRLLLRIVPVTTTPIFAGGRGLPYCVVLLDAGCLATSSRIPAGSSTDTVQEYGHHQHHLLGMYSERAT